MSEKPEESKNEKQRFQDRVRRAEEFRALDVNPYPYTFDKQVEAKAVLAEFDGLEAEQHTGKIVSFAGRLMTLRNMGKLSFAHVQDQSGRIQISFKRDELGDAYNTIKKFDIGDFIGITGEVYTTKKGEITIGVQSFTMLCKAVRDLPEKYHGLQDTELRYRRRYLDLVMNEDVRRVFEKRSVLVQAVREFFLSKGFMEVETPLLQTQYGGANARPFKTHINAWDMDMYLSIAPELYLKRLIVGGYEKVFTICKNFRNEGVDHSHNPEFTMLEAYQAYADYNDMMTLIEECYEFVCTKVNGGTKVRALVRHPDGKKEEVDVDFKAPWPRKTMLQTIQDVVGIDASQMSVEELISFCQERKLELPEQKTWGNLLLTIFDELVEHTIVQPTHVIDRPIESTPLCKIHREDERLVEQNEPIAIGMELGNMYSELNDPVRQRELLQEQSDQLGRGDEEAHPMDEDFVRSIEHGMPPTGGIGFGLDRMAVLLCGQDSLRDVILFPTMRPEGVKENTTGKAKETLMAVAVINNSQIKESWEKYNTFSHLSAALAARKGKELLYQDQVTTRDGHEIALNIQHAILNKQVNSDKEIRDLIEQAKASGLLVTAFTRDMLVTTDDKKVASETAAKNYMDVEFLGVLVFGKKSTVDKLTKGFTFVK